MEFNLVEILSKINKLEDLKIKIDDHDISEENVYASLYLTENIYFTISYGLPHYHIMDSLWTSIRNGNPDYCLIDEWINNYAEFGRQGAVTSDSPYGYHFISAEDQKLIRDKWKEIYNPPEFVTIAKHICKTNNIGISGNLFGGWMMYWLDEAGAILASEYINNRKVVTVKMSEINFKHAVKTGDVIDIQGRVSYTGKSSIKVQMKAISNNKVVCDCEAIFVHVGEDGKAKPI